MKRIIRFFIIIILTGIVFSCPPVVDVTTQPKPQPVSPKSGWYTGTAGYIPVTLFVEGDASWGWGAFALVIPYAIDFTKNVPTNWQIPSVSAGDLYEMDISSLKNPDTGVLYNIHFKQSSHFPN